MFGQKKCVSLNFNVNKYGRRDLEKAEIAENH